MLLENKAKLRCGVPIFYSAASKKLWENFYYWAFGTPELHNQDQTQRGCGRTNFAYIFLFAVRNSLRNRVVLRLQQHQLCTIMSHFRENRIPNLVLSLHKASRDGPVCQRSSRCSEGRCHIRMHKPCLRKTSFSWMLHGASVDVPIKAHQSQEEQTTEQVYPLLPIICLKYIY